MTDLHGKTICVIGGAGFIGSHVVEQLLQHDVAAVIVYDDFSRGTTANLIAAVRDPRVRVFEAGGNILHADILQHAVRESQRVCHLAALWLLQCEQFPDAAFEVNVRGTYNVLEACRQAGIERLVFSSSASVYGNAVEVPMTEEHPFLNTTFYGATKIAGEAMVHSYAHRYRIPTALLRYMNVYGPRQDYKGAYIAVIMRMLDRLDQGLPPVIHGDGSAAYDFVFVEDCARANVLALGHVHAAGPFNIGSGQQTTLRSLAELLIELRGVAVAPEYLPQDQIFVTNRLGSTEKAARELGFEASTGLREGLLRLIEWRDADRNKTMHSPS
jgi:UDP-glucose 4-epimerase